MAHQRQPLSRASTGELSRPKPAPKDALNSPWTLSFLASILHIFVEYLRPQEKYELLSGIPLGELSFGLLLAGAFVSRTGIAVWHPVSRWAIALLLWAFICVFFASSISSAMQDYLDTLKVVAALFFISAAIQTRQQLYIFVNMMLLLFFLHTNFSFRVWALSGFSGYSGGAYVGSGFLANPNDYGAALASFWGISLLLATINSGRTWFNIKRQWVYMASTAFFMIGVLTSSSRGAALAVLAGATYYVLAYTKNFKQKVAWVILVVVGISVFLMLLSEGQSARFDHLGSVEDASAQDRLRTWDVAIQVFHDYPIFGTGIGQFIPLAYSYAPGEIIFVQHNIFLQCLTDLGIIGFLLFARLLLAFFSSQRASLRNFLFDSEVDSRLGAILIGANVSMISFLVAGQFITVLFYPFLWILLIISIAASRIIGPARLPPMLSKRRNFTRN